MAFKRTSFSVLREPRIRSFLAIDTRLKNMVSLPELRRMIDDLQKENHIARGISNYLFEFQKNLNNNTPLAMLRSNPYRELAQLLVELKVFNGEDDMESETWQSYFDKLSPNEQTNLSNMIREMSREESKKARVFQSLSNYVAGYLTGKHNPDAIKIINDNYTMALELLVNFV